MSQHLCRLWRFMKNDITFSYGIRITKFLAHWKYGCNGYVMNIPRSSFGFYIVFHIVILEKVWFMLVGFSCDGTCLSWIELILDLGM